MSVLEIWGAEYQENDCLPDHAPRAAGLLEAICDRGAVPDAGEASGRHY